MYWSFQTAYRNHKEFSLWHTAFIIGAIISVAFLIRIWALGDYSLFDDEILTEFRAQASFQESVNSILKTGDQTPLYFFVLRTLPTDTEFLLRLPSVVFGILGILVMMVITQELYKQTHLSLLVGAWLAVNPFHVFISRTARHYALIFFIAALISYQFLRLYQNTSSNKRQWLLFGALSAAAYTTHYSVLALPGAQFVYILYRGDLRTRFTWHWFKAQTAASLPALVWLGIVVSVYESRSFQWSRTPRVDDLAFSFWNFIAGYDGSLNWTVLPVVLMCGGLSIYAMLPPRRTAVTPYWFLMTAAPMIGVYLVSIMFVDLYQDRYFTALLPGVVLLIVDGLRHFSLQRQVAALSILIITGLTSVGATFKEHTYIREDWRAVSHYLDEHYEQADYVVIDRAVTLTALARYSRDTSDMHFIQLDETDIPVPELKVGKTYWLIYPNPDPDMHILGQMPDFNVLKNYPTVVSQWLQDYQDFVVDYVMFEGIAIVKLVR
jgi:uncharacterized membrane protein